MGLPRHLQVPLSIDTSISYDLDQSKFPGLDDPRYKHEPVLLIASDQVHNYGDSSYGHDSTTWRLPDHQIRSELKMDPPANCGYKSELIGDLLGIIDIRTQDLLLGLRNTDEYLSLVEDVIQGLPQSDELQYLDGPLRSSDTINNIQCSNTIYKDMRSVNSCVSVRSDVPNGYVHPHSTFKVNYSDLNNRGNQQEMCLKNIQSVNCCVSKDHCGYKRHVLPASDPYQSSCLNSVNTKRKRVAESFNSIHKRPCYGNEQMKHLSQYQRRFGNYGNGLIGITHGNQVRVM